MRTLPLSTPALLHPITCGALALWAVNDHVLKGWANGAVTGKLSDVAALVVCPVVLFGIFDWCTPALPDVTDLYTLVALGVPWWLLRRRA